jgi:hypothetical protein
MPGSAEIEALLGDVVVVNRNTAKYFWREICTFKILSFT